MKKPFPSRRRGATLASGALVAGLLPLLMSAPAATAAEGCLADVNRSLFQPTGCDDTTPPDTQITGSTPQTNGAGYIRTSKISFSFAGNYADADKGTLAYKCRLDAGTWAPCTSPVTYSNLADNKSGYLFQVYAIDATDAGLAWSDSTNILSPKTEPDPTDADQTPAEMSFKVDTTAPSTFIFESPYDEVRPELPMVTSRNIALRVDSNEKGATPLTFECTLNKVKVPCREGQTALRNLTPGNKIFQAQAIDLAGNRDPSPATTVFAVPRNLKAPGGSGWRTRKGVGYYGADFLEARKAGVTLVTKPVTVRELRLIAPAGPNLGVIDIQIGNGQRKTIRLSAPTYTKFKVYVIRTEYQPSVTGRITIRVKSLGKHRVARIDALLVQPLGDQTD